ncbi:hypothetical protein [Plantibacter sp. YIM 135347]|jgi:hypothetical protein|uniref:hypothetical protein n=1 Tax=Plantibacter sp. YIM 135347 TaxID=3423919 RepID=UPI003D329405
MRARTTAEAGADRTAPDRAQKTGPIWLSWTVAVLFGLFFAYDVFEAIGNLVGILALSSQLGPMNALAWIVLPASIVLPLVAFAIAYWTGRRKRILEQAVRFFVALCVVAALWQSVLALFGPYSFFDIPLS